jgi:replicative DNA helicase
LTFNEEAFLYALSTRREDTRRFSQYFRPEWLNTVSYRPILGEIYNFLKKYDTPPTFATLHEVFEKKDKSQYDARYKEILEKLSERVPDGSEMIYNLDLARQVAQTRSFTEMITSEELGSLIKEFDGSELLKAVEGWKRQFEGKTDSVEMDLREAVQHTLQRRLSNISHSRVPCGIKILDDWCKGGLRPKQIGIILAPTGAGKSVCLMNIADKMAAVEDKNVLFISNELSMEENVERFVAKILGENLSRVIDDDSFSFDGLKRHWELGLHKKLRLVEISRDMSADDIEAMAAKYANLYGWFPEIIVVDYMERMKPNEKGFNRTETWTYYGQICRDLCRAAKRNNWIIWTAAQTNRGGSNYTKNMDGSDAQGSIQHLQEAWAVVGVRKLKSPVPLDDPEASLLQFTQIKFRENPNEGETAIVEARLGRMNITRKIRDPGEWDGLDEDDKEEWMKNGRSSRKSGSGS